MNMPFDLLLGRKTFEIWAPYWPQHADIWPGVNTATKYIASKTLTSHEWQPSVFLNGAIAEKVVQIKQQPGPDLHVWGSGNLIQTLIKHHLVDAFWLMIYPITLGGANGCLPRARSRRPSFIKPAARQATHPRHPGAQSWVPAGPVFHPLEKMRSWTSLEVRTPISGRYPSVAVCLPAWQFPDIVTELSPYLSGFHRV
jgi:dihydrofolate reductase